MAILAREVRDWAKLSEAQRAEVARLESELQKANARLSRANTEVAEARLQVSALDSEFAAIK